MGSKPKTKTKLRFADVSKHTEHLSQFHRFRARVRESDQKSVDCAYLTALVFGRWQTRCRRVVGSPCRRYELPQGSMISGYLCLRAVLLSGRCPQCQDHHGKSIPMGIQGLHCSFHYYSGSKRASFSSQSRLFLS